MKKFWFLILLGTIFACGTTNAELKEQSLAQSILDETKTQAKVMCKIIVKRFRLSDQTHEPVEEAEVTIIKSKVELPTPGNYVVLGSMTVEAGNECKIIEITDAVKTGAGTLGAKYVLPWKIETIQNSKEWGTEIDKHKWVEEKTLSSYILLKPKQEKDLDI